MSQYITNLTKQYACPNHMLALILHVFLKFIRVSNSLDSDQGLCFVGPDLGSNCLQRLSVDDTMYW